MFFDGASNAIRHGIGAILISPEGSHYPFTTRLSFNCTNNIAEYKAYVMGLKAAIERGNRTLQVFGDSTLIIYQLKGDGKHMMPNQSTMGI